MELYQRKHTSNYQKISFRVISQRLPIHLLSSQPKARVKKAFVYRRVMTTAVVQTMAMILIAINVVPLGLDALKLGVTPGGGGGGVGAAIAEDISADHIGSIACTESCRAQRFVQKARKTKIEGAAL